MGIITKRVTSLCQISSNECYTWDDDSVTVSPSESAFEDKFLLGEQLGWGQFGVIRTCSDKLTGEILACKSIAKDRLVKADDLSNVKLEIDIMMKLSGHPNVVYLKEVYEEPDNVHLVMELCAGGELFHQLEMHGRFSESHARILFKQLMEVVMYCHRIGIVHRDLKPENILLTSKSPHSPLKLADFGLAAYIKPGQRLYETVGSPFYIAPEVLAGSYNEAADVWSAGVILYILLSGNPPFWGKTKSKIFEAVRAADLRFPSNSWHQVSPSAKDLISRMLCVDPLQRLTADQVLEHTWIKNYVELSEGIDDMDMAYGHLSTSESFCPEYAVPRTGDISFGAASPFANRDDSPAFTCRTSFSSFLAPGHGSAQQEHFSFHSCNGSHSLVFCIPVVTMPSFTFCSPGSAKEVSLMSLQRDVSFSALASSNNNGKHHVTGSRGSGTSKARGIHSKRNRTIGFGEIEQVNLAVTETIIRWMSCTQLSSTPALRASLVC